MMTLPFSTFLRSGTAALALAVTATGWTQTTPSQAPANNEPDPIDGEEIIVTGERLPGSVIGDIPPENILDTRDIRATGATGIAEILEALGPQLGSARGRGGERPILLLNGRRVSGFRELRDIPSEAIMRVEILPEEVALKYGYRADQRVVNFILRPRFRSTVARVEGTAATEGGYGGGEAEVTRLLINRASRTTINLRADANSALTESERDIDLRDPGGVDDREFRTLVGSRRLIRGSATVNRPIGEASATLNGEVEHSEGRSLLGLTEPLLERRARDTSSDNAHLGLVVNGDQDRWRWSATGNLDWLRSLTRSDPIDGASRDRNRTVRQTAELDLLGQGPLFSLFGNEANGTFKAGGGTLHLDTSRRSSVDRSSNDLSRSQAAISGNVDLPLARRNKGSRLGNLSLSANGELTRLSDFGTLSTVGGGANWSPARRLSLIASFTREEGAPGLQQLGDPVLVTEGSRIFDFVTGETALVTSVTGGNPALDADRRTVWKLGGNWQPKAETDLRLRAEYVDTRIEDPIYGFPGVSEALEAAFPERFTRDSDGRLVRVDLRPVNFEEARRKVFRWGFDFTKPLKSKTPSREQIQQLAGRFFPGGFPGRPTGQGQSAPDSTGASQQSQPQRQQPEGQAPQQANPAAPGTEPSPPGVRQGPRGAGSGGGPRFGGFGGGGFGGGPNRGRLQLSVTHTVNFVDEAEVRPGLPVLDFLSGDASGSTGGRPRHEVEAQGGWFNNGLGARLSAKWRGATEVDSATGDDLRFSPLTTFDLRLFANLGEQFSLLAKYPWLRGTSVRLEVDNLLDSKPRVRRQDGSTPVGFQSDLLDPLGRTVSLSIRKLFSPSPAAIMRRASSGGD